MESCILCEVDNYLRCLMIFMGQSLEQFKERLKRGPQTFHPGFAVTFIICCAIAAFFAIYMVWLQGIYLALSGVIVAGISAVILVFGIWTPDLNPIFEEIQSKILAVVRDHGPLPPIQVAYKLDYPEETVLDAIRFLIEEGQLVKNADGKVICGTNTPDPGKLRP